MRDEHDFGTYILSLDTLVPANSVICVLPAFLRPLQPLLGLALPRVREAVQGFNKIREAGKFWVEHRMQTMARKEATRTDLLDKFFQVRQAKSDFDIPEIQNESVVAM